MVSFDRFSEKSRTVSEIPKKKKINKKSWERTSASDQTRRDPTTRTEVCVGQECSGIFTVKKDKMDVFKEGIVLIFFFVPRCYEVDKVISLSLSFLHRHLLDVICAKIIIIANVEA